MRGAIRSPTAGALIATIACAGSALGAAPAPSMSRSVTAEIVRAVPGARARLAATVAGTVADGQSVRLTGRAFSPHAAIAVAQCGAQALAQALKSVSGALDYCDARFVAVAASDAAGSFSVRSRVLGRIQTASGQIDCRAGGCLLGALNLVVLQGGALQVAVMPIAFRGSANPTPTLSTGAPRFRIPRRGTLAVLRPGHRARLTLQALPARTLGSGRIGQIVGIPALAAPRRPASGEGLLGLTMSAPGTSWGDSRNTSVVVQARVDHKPWQVIVLFAGARPFTYEGFTGPLTSGPHTVEVRVRPDLSQVARHAALALVRSASLRVVSAQTPGGMALQYAPVLYDRRISATGDTPLITYADEQVLTGGARRLSYVVTWTHEDAGTGFLPWLEWGTWGRMTDIESAISFTVSRSGRVSDTSYLACTLCGRGFSENRTAIDETDVPFHGAWFGHHPILRVSTGNNDFSDQGVTQMRFQQALAAPPRPGQTREGAMDLNPWTYGVMDAELRRERDDFSEDPASPAPGAATQYLIVDLDASTAHTGAVGVDIRVAGEEAVYSNDLGTTYPLYNGGHGRTVVKLPLKLIGRPIAMLRLRLLASGSLTPAITVNRLRVLQSTGDRIIVRRFPRPLVTIEPSPPSSPPRAPAPTVSLVPATR
jgi:hypothetical protein